MAAEGTGGSKLAELVTDHIFCHVNRNVLAAVIDRDGVADEGEKIVELRLQVLRTFFSPVLFISSTRLMSSGATNGPFLMLLLIFTLPPFTYRYDA